MLPKLCRDSHWGWGRITSSWSPLTLILFSWILYCSLLVGTPLVAVLSSHTPLFLQHVLPQYTKYTNLYTLYTKMDTVRYSGEMQMGDGSGGNLHSRTEPEIGLNALLDLSFPVTFLYRAFPSDRVFSPCPISTALLPMLFSHPIFPLALPKGNAYVTRDFFPSPYSKSCCFLIQSNFLL